jgi:HK97 family phage prohead protease
MPWSVVHNHPACRSGEWAVVNQRAEAEGRHSIEGCHPTREAALAQQRALYANEPQARSHEVQMMERKTLVAPVEWKAVPGDPGTLEGYLSVFGNIDEGGDVVLPGAFKKTIALWQQSGRRIPLLVDHKLSTEGVVGSIDRAQEDQVGVKVRASFSSIAKAQDIRTLMVEGHLGGMSFTYEPLKARPGMKDGRRVRFLEELRLFEGTITPFPMNTLAMAAAKTALAAAGAVEDKAVSDKPWSQFTEADYTLEQWRRACLISIEGATDTKAGYKLPVREPDGTLNRNAVHAAAGGHGVGAVTGISAEKKQAAARAIVSLYRSQLGEDPPPSLLQLAGQSSASLDFDLFTDAMRKALEIEFEPARKAAVDQLVAAYQTAAVPTPDGSADAASDAAPNPTGTKDAGGLPGSSAPPAQFTPREYVDDVLQRVEQADGSPASLDALEAKIRQSLGGAA